MTSNSTDFGGYYVGREVVGAVFAAESDALSAIQDLKERGYHADKIGLAAQTADGKYPSAAGSTFGTAINSEAHPIVPSDAGADFGSHTTVGVLGGGALGALGGWLVAAAGLSIPGVGPILVGGTLAGLLGATAATAAAGAGVGAIGGGIAAALVSSGLIEEDANYFDERFRAGHVIVTVRSDDVAEAANILKAHGGDLGPGANRVRPDVAGMTTGAAVGGIAGALVGSIPGALIGEAVGAAVGAAISEAVKNE